MTSARIIKNHMKRKLGNGSFEHVTRMRGTTEKMKSVRNRKVLRDEDSETREMMREETGRRPKRTDTRQELEHISGLKDEKCPGCERQSRQTARQSPPPPSLV